MSKGRKPGQQAEKRQFSSLYLMELARGSSHIASTLSPATQHEAIAEVLQEFRLQHGADKLLLFRDLLAQRLKDRENPQAAQAVLSFDPR
ncbi:conserved hypothetical protein [Paraburkholderia ribeironis]|uniref:Uncharacterized protein n=1 Tax=Paraburkholderia ribeironis TaxID=1247936 RepID=A0A1N7RW15_9BURK|nr:hypothetical protein [Paraburkholderia ribeironis]SIT39278.1 conserved hypothetical protein [Paraburkholderia ribeironis]